MMEMIKVYCNTHNSEYFQEPYSPHALAIIQSENILNVKVDVFTAQINHKEESTFACCTNLIQQIHIVNMVQENVIKTPRYNEIELQTFNALAFVTCHDEVKCIVAT